MKLLWVCFKFHFFNDQVEYFFFKNNDVHASLISTIGKVNVTTNSSQATIKNQDIEVPKPSFL